MGIFLTLINGDLSNDIEKTLIKINLSIIVSFFLSVGLYLILEDIIKDKIKQNLFQFLTIGFGIFFYFGINFEYVESIVFFILTLAGIISFLFFAPFIKEIKTNILDKEIYFGYIYNLIFSILFSIFIAIIINLLGFLGFFAANELFNLNFSEKIYLSWFVISYSFIAPLYVLGHISKKENIEKIVLNSFGNFIIKYILVPFIYIFFIILYAYSIKVILNFNEWPNGIISWLVIIFSIFGYLTYIYSSNIEEENKTIKFFRKYFPFVVLPQLFMLFYAIYLRIEQYGITINRYFVVVFGVWLTIISLYYIVSKIKSLSFIFAILTIFTIIISVGPWGVYNLPEKSQYNLLIEKLKEAKIMQNGKIIPLKKEEDISEDLSKNIYSKIDYICRYHSCNILTSGVFKNEYNELLKTNKNPKYYDIINYLTDYIKVRNYYNNSYEEKNIISIYLKDGIYPLNIEGYKEIITLESFYQTNKNEKIAFIDLKTNSIKIYENNKIIKEINIKEIIDKLKTYKSGEINKNDLTFEINGYKIVFTNIYLQLDDKLETKKDGNMNGFLMIK